MKHSGSMLPLALKALFKKPATVSYPAGREDVPTTIRGKLKFDPSKCIGCKLCTRDCPSGAIEIIKVGDKQFKAVLRMDKCIYCGQCVDSCNKGALKCTPEFELAAFHRKDLEVEI
jgi:formate hydrogenlyase subunit 6/NADH:ubiquinone oxidoreductase subunit I